jgi:hypothetical protein
MQKIGILQRIPGFACDWGRSRRYLAVDVATSAKDDARRAGRSGRCPRRRRAVRGLPCAAGPRGAWRISAVAYRRYGDRAYRQRQERLGQRTKYGKVRGLHDVHKDGVERLPDLRRVQFRSQHLNRVCANSEFLGIRRARAHAGAVRHAGIAAVRRRAHHQHSQHRQSALAVRSDRAGVYSRQKSSNRFGASAVQTAMLVIDRWPSHPWIAQVSRPLLARA